MCDTLVALGNSTSNKKVLFAKNSDRDPNEAQYPIFEQGRKYPSDSKVKCTYIEIPQVSQTWSILLSKPFWMWGGEMGANEHGVVIGNEAVFTKVKKDGAFKLLGMDLLRLALERAKTAEEALQVIIDLLEVYGQGGNCGFVHKLDYDNSYLIADKKEAWVLETAGKEWAAEKVKEVRSISNRITITNKWDLASENLVKNAVDQGWCKNRSDFNFARCYSEPIFTTFSGSAGRLECTAQKLAGKQPAIDIQSLMEFLRTHSSEHGKGWSPANALTGSDVCMHFGFGPIRINQTTASMVSEIGDADATHWLTASSTPCTSIFKPFWFEAGLPEIPLEASGEYDQKAFWWNHEKLARSIMRDYQNRLGQISSEIRNFQEETIQKADKAQGDPASDKKILINELYTTEFNLTKSWLNRIENLPIKTMAPFYYRQNMNKVNQQANLM